jgi:hypothetical protein
VVFNSPTEKEDEPGDTVRNADESLAKSWGWFGVMYRLTNGDLTKLQNIVKMELYTCLTWLCYETDLEASTKQQRKNGSTQ